MFNNLIESSSHAREYKRRGSFLFFTTAVYAVLLVLGGWMLSTLGQFATRLISGIPEYL